MGSDRDPGWQIAPDKRASVYRHSFTWPVHGELLNRAKNHGDLSGKPKDLTEIDFFLAETDAAAARDHDGLVVERVIDVRQSLVDARRRLVDLDRTFHVQRFVRTFVVEDVDKFVKAGLLSKEIRGRRLGGLFFQSEMLWLANCYGRADFTGAAQVNWLSLSERIRWL